MKWSNGVEKLLEMIRIYEESLGMKSKAISNPVDDYLNMPLDKMKRLSQDECREIALVLSQYSIFIQRTYNEQMNIANTAKNHLNRMIVDDMQQVRAVTTDERRCLVIKNNEAARKTEQVMNEALFKANQINGIANLVLTVAKAYENLSFVRRVQ